MFTTRSSSRLAAAAITAAAAFASAAGTASAAETAVAETTSRPDSRIVNGYTPHPSQWPWMAAVGYSKAANPSMSGYQRQYCGGALIAPRVVLTAAHCVVNKEGRTPASAIGVALGRRDLNDSAGEDHEVVDVQVHPSYDTATFKHDVALLRLASNSAYTPAALDPGFQLAEGMKPSVMGWGHEYSGGEGTQDLRAVDVPLQSSTQCVAAYADFNWKHDPSTMLCAGWAQDGYSTCQGDSGGPLMLPDSQGTWRLIGTVSWADRCAIEGRPTNYAWIGSPAIKPWIESTTARLNEPDPAPVAQPAAAPQQPVSAPSSAAPSVRRVRISGLRARGRSLRFSLSQSGTVTIKVVSRSGRVLRVIRRSGRSGRNTVRLPRLRGARKVSVTVRGANGTSASSAAKIRR